MRRRTEGARRRGIQTRRGVVPVMIMEEGLTSISSQHQINICDSFARTCGRARYQSGVANMDRVKQAPAVLSTAAASATYYWWYFTTPRAERPADNRRIAVFGKTVHPPQKDNVTTTTTYNNKGHNHHDYTTTTTAATSFLGLRYPIQSTLHSFIPLHGDL